MTYHSPMDRTPHTGRSRNAKMLVSLAGAGLVLSACGHTPVSLKGPDRVQEARAIILKRVRSFHSEEVQATVDVTGSHGTLAASVNVKANGAYDVREVIDSGNTSLTAVANGTDAWTYAVGGSRYGVASTLAPSGYDLRWATTDLGTLLSAVTFTQVRTLPDGRWRVSFSGNPTALGAVHGTLLYGSKSGVPRGLTLDMGDTTVAMTFLKYGVNPTFGHNTFLFTPPTGTLGVLGGGTAIAQVDSLQKRLRFALALPGVRSDLTLTSATAVTGTSFGTEVLMQFMGSAGPLLVTEYASRFGLPTAPASAYTLRLGGLQVAVSTISTQSTEAVTEDAGTAVIAEGGDAEITTAIQDLALTPKG